MVEGRAEGVRGRAWKRSLHFARKRAAAAAAHLAIPLLLAPSSSFSCAGKARGLRASIILEGLPEEAAKLVTPPKGSWMTGDEAKAVADKECLASAAHAERVAELVSGPEGMAEQAMCPYGDTAKMQVWVGKKAVDISMRVYGTTAWVIAARAAAKAAWKRAKEAKAAAAGTA